MGAQDFWIWTARIQNGKLQRTGFNALSIFSLAYLAHFIYFLCFVPSISKLNDNDNADDNVGGRVRILP